MAQYHRHLAAFFFEYARAPQPRSRALDATVCAKTRNKRDVGMVSAQGMGEGRVSEDRAAATAADGDAAFARMVRMSRVREHA